MESNQVSSCVKVESQPAATTASNPLSSFFSKNVFQNVVIIILICVIFYMISQIKTLSNKITSLTVRVDDQDNVIDRHEMVLKKIMTLLGNKQSPTKKVDDLLSVQSDKPEFESSNSEQDIQQPPQLQAPNPMALFGTLLSSIAPMAASPLQEESKFTTSSIEELDSELKDEIVELAAK